MERTGTRGNGDAALGQVDVRVSCARRDDAAVPGLEYLKGDAVRVMMYPTYLHRRGPCLYLFFLVVGLSGRHALLRGCRDYPAHRSR
jgi:hypothetical protein